MRKMTVLGASALLVAGLVASPAAAFAAPVLTDTEQYLDGVQVCEDYDSGKIDTTGDPMEVTVDAPAGQLISGYCVKAGSVKQGEGVGGAYFVELDEPAASVTITYPWGGGDGNGRAISHYALVYTDGVIEPTPSPSPSVPGEEPSDEPSVVPSELGGDEPTEPGVEPSDGSVAPADEAATPSPSAAADEPDVLASTGASTAIGFTLIALALVGGGVTLIVLRRKGVLGS
ncbi:LPXTG cell wall anchor domain-containing protein [Promicromonospora sp. NPDC057138]|uniref:LPXTG cell wall anchor domain-containing protein n=1 Tax=Promicromonospora sp. NPDC057138 TaxID=3346031 RepID=UPI00363EF96E